MRASEILDMAAGAIEVFGWVQGRGGNEDEGFCPLGAIERVAVVHNLSAWDSEAAEAEAALGALGASRAPENLWSGAGAIAFWNDLDSQTKEHVVSGIREAADALRVRGL